MSIRTNTFEAGTRVHIVFEDASLDDTSVTMDMFTPNSIEIKIWENEQKITARTFINVDDLLDAVDIFRKLKTDGVITD